MNPRRLVGPALALALLAALSAAGFSQEEGYKFRLSNFSLEFYGGYSTIEPADLKNHAVYEEAFLQFYMVKYYGYLHSIYGDNYVVTSTRTGDSEFRTLKKAVPYGLRLRYQVSPTFSLSLGVQFLDGTQLSNVGLTLDVEDRRPDDPDNPKVRTVQYQNTGFTTQAKAWMPELGLHFGWNLSAVFRSEISIAFEPIFAQCRILTQRRIIATMADGYQSNNAYAEEMKGSGTGLGGEVGIGLFIRPLKNARLFVEGSYSFRELGELSGPGWGRTTSSDSNGVYSDTTENWTGKWLLYHEYDYRSWGQFATLHAQNRYAYDVGVHYGYSRLDPSLSGFQVKAGVGFNF